MHVALGPEWLAPEHLIATFGLLGILVIIFAECGLLIGFFLPGDSLLFTAGLLVADGRYLPDSLPLVCALIALAAILGNQTGYAIGRKAGPAIFNRTDSKLFQQEYVDKAQAFFDKYGARAIVLARFVPIVRTFITVMAGVSRMNYRTYLIYTIIGGVLWGVGVTTLGYFLGQIAFVREHIEAILIGIVALSLIPVAIEVWRASRVRRTGRGRGPAPDDGSGSAQPHLPTGDERTG